MPKQGKAKNTKNKAKHSKLMLRKTNKLRAEKLLHQQRLKELLQKQREQQDKIAVEKTLKDL
jgi:hypothetical protein|tara:strand:- start:12887 stop:13072 length:186 start_codon:yes stop_codon:yes gene_type:complete